MILVTLIKLIILLQNADEAVAYGAAVQGGILSGEGGEETGGIHYSSDFHYNCINIFIQSI